MIAPGSVIGILGGGQLGRMLALAAHDLGYRPHIYAPEEDSPALDVTPLRTVAAYDDEAALDRFARTVDVVTFEFENVPEASAVFLAERKPVRPSPAVLAIAQDRTREKEFIRGAGLDCAPYAIVRDAHDAAQAAASLGTPILLKSVRMGYDGKGQKRIERAAEAVSAWHAIGANAIAEAWIDFSCEISVIVARSPSGAIKAYEPVENQHRDQILHRTIVPARIDAEIARRAVGMAETLAEALALEGLLAVEMFVTQDRRVLVNEIAPRPHNSGHWTMDACTTSQFAQTVRAICDLPLGEITRLCPCEMTNLLGEDINQWPALLREGHNKLHLYRKAVARAGRKMGHVTRLFPILPGRS
ncbi:MAG TPA: 5-(carboxyamino)imidazole ribonucleotide synthase [Dongiaceae bacterium]|jgi:5-(carboxyamino)imidazole ribonucleotide synthase|nr:5-(carboxyamino)imidazole ribonucleotide synthase [Dongiaceae bacterium]